MNEDIFLSERLQMVKRQLVSRGIDNPRVLDAMRDVPRHRFVPIEQRRYAYLDGPLPIGHGQTISQPYVVALMTQLLSPKEDETVLEIGTGSGYQAAILAKLAKCVHSIERHAELAQTASESLAELGIDNVTIHIGDGTLGLSEHAPYAGIIVTAAAPSVPEMLLEQLGETGRLVIPVGSRGTQYLEIWKREGSSFTNENIIPVAFVPLIGKFGWQQS